MNWIAWGVIGLILLVAMVVLSAALDDIRYATSVHINNLFIEKTHVSLLDTFNFKSVS